MEAPWEHNGNSHGSTMRASWKHHGSTKILWKYHINQASKDISWKCHSRTFIDVSMQAPCKHHESTTDPPCFHGRLHRSTMEVPWKHRGCVKALCVSVWTSMRLPWKHSTSMEASECLGAASNGASMETQQRFHDTSMDTQSVGVSWCSRGDSKVLPWGFHGNTVFPWQILECSHGTSMELEQKH